MVFECAKKVEEDLGRDLERLDEVALLEDCVRHAHQRLLVRQLRDAEHVDAPLFRVFQNLRKTINEVGLEGELQTSRYFPIILLMRQSRCASNC